MSTASLLRILGIDPGFDRTGFGLIEQAVDRATWITHGCIQTSAKQSFSERLLVMRNELRALLETYHPDCVAVEQLFFQSNAKTALKVGMARGVILVTLAEMNLPLVEITPNQVKQGLTGWGGADKKQVQDMVQRSLKLSASPTPDDAADALAIAIVGGLVYRVQRRLS